MGYKKHTIGLFIVGFCLTLSSPLFAFKIGDVNFDNTFALQSRNYENKAVSPVQRRHEFATAYFQQEISYTWNRGKDSWVFTPYLMTTRYEDPWRIEHEGYVPFVVPIPIFDFGDTRTTHRTYGDIRELLWTHVADDYSWELRTGIGKVFWGKTESQHLVDVINQDDLRSDIDEEDKLGQPMINLTIVKDYGNFDFFVLPGFREKKYQENVGRLTPLFMHNPYQENSQTNVLAMVNQDDAIYESGAEELHTDFAFRWSHSIGISDLGISYFQGTNRDPVFLSPINEDLFLTAGAPNLNDPNNTGGWGAALSRPDPSFPSVRYVTPYYEQMSQYGFDYQATVEGWLLKFEGIYRDSDSLKTPVQDNLDNKASDFTTDYSAITAGFEYTFTGVFDTPADLGVLVEYLWDSREYEATTPYQDDVFLGLRYAHNSIANPSFLMGIIRDTELESYTAILEANRRVGDDSKIIIEAINIYAEHSARADIAPFTDASIGFAEEDHVRLAWETYF